MATNFASHHPSRWFLSLMRAGFSMEQVVRVLGALFRSLA
jgi:hypothetical protein